ncbi:aspartate/glutamate racemase family protein [Arthrobacter sp. M4]|uniref:aspartate/glutamate racemase family protein n=1 Tax=Arthrobacter sp. M4 TaxID=218160 RepID=UPI001CDBF475|nr:aspartate/glutamate racemase family protein [Arthrobacter sp. M4]MCA4131791.1 aspartate/glutamate racemase family protein [Arthrobacter sp. M4]
MPAPQAPQTIVFIHTVSFLVEEFKKRMAEELPAVKTRHVLNESLLQDLLAGVPTTMVYRRVVEQVLIAADAGADLIVMTCSSTSPAVDIARQLTTIPIIKIDDPMALSAVHAGRNIGLVCTATSTVAPSTALLRAHAGTQDLNVTVLLESDAYDALLGGDRDLHDKIVTAAAVDLAPRVDTLVLAQASLMHLQGPISAATATPVLASPPLLMQELHRLLSVTPELLSEGAA